jgi:hypothetical protein
LYSGSTYSVWISFGTSAILTEVFVIFFSLPSRFQASSLNKPQPHPSNTS